MDFKLTKDQSSKNNDSETGKVIRLNTRLTRRVQMRRELNHKKGAAIASVLSIIALVTVLNQNLISKSQTDTLSRNIASAESELKLKAWKADILKDLSDKKNRNIASYGEAPTPIEELRMGVLEGKYSFEVKDSVIEEIRFIETPDGDRPKSFRSYSDLIQEHKKAFGPEVNSVVELGEESTENQKVYTFEAYDEFQKPTGKILVVADPANRLLEVKYQRRTLIN